MLPAAFWGRVIGVAMWKRHRKSKRSRGSRFALNARESRRAARECHATVWFLSSSVREVHIAVRFAMRTAQWSKSAVQMF